MPAAQKKDEAKPAVESEEVKLQRARSAAVSRLRDENRERYNALLTEEAEKRGITWKPKPTKKEKAAEQMRRLLEEYPELAEAVQS
jgi:hypothetical protein